MLIIIIPKLIKRLNCNGLKFSTLIKCIFKPTQVTKRDLLLSARNIYLIGREKVASGPDKGQIKDVVKRLIPVAQVKSISLRYEIIVIKIIVIIAFI